MNHRKNSPSGPLHLHIGHHFWGAGNIGDDWMLAGFLAAVKLRGLEFRITCCTQHDLESMRRRFPQIEWFGMAASLRETLIASADVWVGLGDTPFQSHAGTWLLDHIVEDLGICRRFETPVYFLAVGAEGPEACRLPQTSRILGQARRVWTRDQLSASLLGAAAGGQTRITQAADLAHLYFGSLPAPETNRLTGAAGLVINVERTGQLDVAELAKFISLRQGPPIRWIAQEVRNLQVSEVCLWENFSPAVRERLVPAIPDYQTGTLESFLALYAGLPALLSTRYHSTLAAAWRGVAVSVYARSQKLDGLVNQLGCTTCESLTSAEKIAEGLANAKPIRPSALREAARAAQAACDDFFEEILEARPVPKTLRATTGDKASVEILDQAGHEPPGAGKQAGRILWVRTDSIGDVVLASAMLEPLRKKFPHAKLAVLCQMHVAELFTACPFVDSIICYDRKKMGTPAEREQIISEITAFQPDLILNSVRSRDKLSDDLTLAFGDARHVAIEGDLDNISEADREAARGRYETLIVSAGGHKPELERHADFLRGLGIEARELQPVVWTSPEDEALADLFFHNEQLEPERTLALFPFTQHAIKDYPDFAAALKDFTGWNILLLGGPESRVRCEQLASRLPGNVKNLAGRTSLRGMAALIRRSKLLVGSDSCAAHIAAAVDVPQVVVMGGGHFGRFFPYSPLTTLAVLPMDCYGCIWHCKFLNVQCLQSLEPQVLAEAIAATLKSRAATPRIFIQVDHTGLPAAQQTMSAWLPLETVEIIPVQSEQPGRNFWPALRHGRGVHQDEGGFRWLDTEAEVEVVIPVDGCSGVMSFELQAAELALYPRPPLTVAVLVNGQLAREVAFHANNQVEPVQLSFPPAAQPYCLRFNSSQFFSGAGDSRRLAVRLQKVALASGKDDLPPSRTAPASNPLIPNIHLPASPTQNYCMKNNPHSHRANGHHGNGFAVPKRDLLGEHLKAADFHINQGDLQACRVSMENAVEMAPTDVKILSTLGSLCFQMSDFHGAQKHFERVLQIEPQNPILHVQLATACQRLGDGDGSAIALQRALTIDPGCQEALALVAGVHFNGKRFADAANVYEQLLLRNPNSVEWLLPLAKCRFHLGNAPGSRELYQRVQQLEPGNSVANEALAFLQSGAARRFSIRDIVQENPAIHRDHMGKALTMPISGVVANFIQEHVQDGTRTIETGAGLSTLCFLVQGAVHTAIAPDPSLETRLREYCRTHGFTDSRLTYIAKVSENVVWNLEGEFDCALIDGGHGFPIPFIDFFYLNQRLKKGGFLIIDDLEIWTGETLAKFLSCERAWKLVVQDGNRSIIFQKVGDAQATEWTRQEFVVKSSLHPHYLETVIPREVLSPATAA